MNDRFIIIGSSFGWVDISTWSNPSRISPRPSGMNQDQWCVEPIEELSPRACGVGGGMGFFALFCRFCFVFLDSKSPFVSIARCLSRFEPRNHWSIGSSLGELPRVVGAFRAVLRESIGGVSREEDTNSGRAACPCSHQTAGWTRSGVLPPPRYLSEMQPPSSIKLRYGYSTLRTLLQRVETTLLVAGAYNNG